MSPEENNRRIGKHLERKIPILNDKKIGWRDLERFFV